MALLNVTTAGSKITISASPRNSGFQELKFTVTEAPDEASFYKAEKVAIAEGVRGANGDFIGKIKMPEYKITISTIMYSNSYNQLSQLLLRNAYDRNGKVIADDIVSMTYSPPNGSRETYSNGIIIEGEPMAEHQASGNAKIPKEFSFIFERYEQTPAIQNFVLSAAGTSYNSLKGLLP